MMEDDLIITACVMAASLSFTLTTIAIALYEIAMLTSQ
jgi:hypothetical protein